MRRSALRVAILMRRDVVLPGPALLRVAALQLIQLPPSTLSVCAVM
jgi:hypothetical protein